MFLETQQFADAISLLISWNHTSTEIRISDLFIHLGRAIGIKNQFGNLWLPLTCRDDSGSTVLYITEKAIVKLTNCVDAAEFEQLHAEARLRLPLFASIKIYRRPSKSSAVQPGINRDRICILKSEICKMKSEI